MLGVPEQGKESEARLLHAGFLVLLRQCLRSTGEADLRVIRSYLIRIHGNYGDGVAPGDVVTFSVDGGIYPSRDQRYRSSG